MNYDKDRLAQEARELQGVANFRDKNEKLAWMRKKKKIETIVESDIGPIEAELLKLTTQKQVYMDEVAAIRKEMVRECIHPSDYLIHYGIYIKCRFCEAKISIPKLKND